MSPPRMLRTLPARGTRVRRGDAATQKLESMAAEFALLAQRRARLVRQMDLMARQTRAATTNLEAMERRMHALSLRMRIVDPAALAAQRVGDVAPADAAAQAQNPNQTPMPEPRRGRRNLVLQY